MNIDDDKLRDLTGWEKVAPVPICMGGDYRALTFCCKPGYSLTFGFKCLRDTTLETLGISSEEFIWIKEEFSNENDWDSDIVCFGSMSYCCMRRNGCPRRDEALRKRYPTKNREEFMKIYFSKKRVLSERILQQVKSKEGKKKVKQLMDCLEKI